MSLAPVVVFCYNRYESIVQVMNALSKNDGAKETDVYVYSNAAIKGTRGDNQAVSRVRAALKRYSGFFKSYQVIERAVNTGPNDNMIPAIDEIVHRYGRIIVVEDDIITCKGFLSFMNQALDYYEKDSDVFAICGYNAAAGPCSRTEDTFSYDAFRSWGYGIWADRWDTLDETADAVSAIDLGKTHTEAEIYLKAIKNEIAYREANTWVRFLDYRLACRQIADRKTVIYPVRSFCDNIGIGQGVNSFPLYQGDRNENYDWMHAPSEIVFSKWNLNIDSDPEYFFQFRERLNLLELYRRARDVYPFSVMYYCLSLLLLHGHDIGHYFRKHHIQSAAIYDYCYAGQLLHQMLEKVGVEVSYVIDENGRAAPPDTRLRTYSSLEDLPPTDVIIVSEVRFYPDIEEKLRQHTKLPLCCMDDIILECKVDLLDKGARDLCSIG